jgi:hypothetical protein
MSLYLGVWLSGRPRVTPKDPIMTSLSTIALLKKPIRGAMKKIAYFFLCSVKNAIKGSIHILN